MEAWFNVFTTIYNYPRQRGEFYLRIRQSKKKRRWSLEVLVEERLSSVIRVSYHAPVTTRLTLVVNFKIESSRLLRVTTVWSLIHYMNLLPPFLSVRILLFTSTLATSH